MQVQADYNTGGAPILAHQLTDFANQAQQIWRDEILPANPAHLYNGADIESG
jgi:hypothetical protein